MVEQQRNRAADYMSMRLYPQAVAVLDSLVRARPADSDLFEYLADAHRGAGNVDAAIKAYEQSIRLNYGAFKPHMKLGTLLMENGKTGRALTEFEIAVKSSPSDVLARYNYGVALHETGRHDEALKLRRAILDRLDLQPEHGHALAQVGEGHGRVEVLLEPAQRELHRLSPPVRLGTSSGRKP